MKWLLHGLYNAPAIIICSKHYGVDSFCRKPTALKLKKKIAGVMKPN